MPGPLPAANARSPCYERTGDHGLRGRQELRYFIGSNSAGRSFLFSIDRFLFQAPVTFYAKQQRWDVSPGYENDREMRFNRPIEANCLYCHASQAQPIYGAQNRYAEPPFKHDGVSCERCHGPGSAHAGSGGAVKPVNPATLDPARRDAVCAQCHLSGETRIEQPGKRLAQFRPGELLADYVSYFVFDTAAKRGLKANSHVENLARSLCKQRSGERMWCGSCHDPHSVPAPRERANYFRAKCLACHEEQRLPGDCSRLADCASCHLPKARVVDGGHGVLTDHSIRRPMASRGATEADGAGRRLIPFDGFLSDDRMLGLAYAEVALRSGDRFHESEALRLLTAALKTNPRDAELLTRLGFLHQQRGDEARAARAYEIALQADPHGAIALVNLGGIYAAQGKMEEAVKLWRAALERNAGLTEAAINLARGYRSQGKIEQAREVLQQSLRFDPDSGAARRLLGELEADLRKRKS